MKMQTVADKITMLHKSLPDNVSLVAVSKKKSAAEIIEVAEAGQLDFGENYVQELCEKIQILPKTLRWHAIGHLQTNKVKDIVPFVHLIHGIDSLRLLHEVNKQAKKVNRIIPCLLQVHIAKEETKFGFLTEEVKIFLGSEEEKEYQNVALCGLMGMASQTDDQIKIGQEFAELKSLFDWSKKGKKNFSVLSMGMSSDYKIAIDEGSTLVRIGSLIFGARV